MRYHLYRALLKLYKPLENWAYRARIYVAINRPRDIEAEKRALAEILGE